MSSNKSEKIYRYQRFGAATVQSLCHDQLHFADPTAFNDPLDCQPTVKSDSDRNTLRRILAGFIKKRVEAEAGVSLEAAKLKGKRSAEHAKKLGAEAARSALANIEYHATNPEHEVSEDEAECRLLSDEIQHELLKRYSRGVCCFSSSVDNPVLWSHYGDQHRGFCIGYDLNRNPKPNLHKVIYGGDRTILTSLIAKALFDNDPDSLKLLDRNMLLRKASSWKYERERRMFSHRGVQASPLAMKDVTFGMRCPVSVTHAIIKALEDRHEKVKFYDLYEVPGRFELKRRPVDIHEMQAYLPHTATSGFEAFQARR